MGTTTSALEPSLKSGIRLACIDRVEKPAESGVCHDFFLFSRFTIHKDAKSRAKQKSRIYGIYDLPEPGYFII